MKEQIYTFEVEKPARRIDILLVNYFEDIGGAFSRNSIQNLIRSGNVKIDGKKTKSSKSLSGGERIEIIIPPQPKLEIKPQDIPIRVVYEDDYLIVINKKPNMVVHPAPGNFDGTLVNAVFHHCGGKLSTIGDPTRPGVVHRLDKDTSGLIVMAKDNAVHLDLVRQFAQKSAKKAYIAVVWGRPPMENGRLDTFFGRHHTDRKRFTTKLDSGKKAITSYKIIASSGDTSVLRITPETGRTHQIRVHMYDHGFPIVGDPVYKRRKAKTTSIARQALHAKVLTFFHPVFKEPLTFLSPLEEDIKRLLEELALTNA